ncbi:superinfection exclusion B family protein [Hungatella sp.]|uniref:superinfection exclusion B family protein n=1 Tax=Hungatella sp. TaxID=2613924 RepID=UPI002A823ED9|nr:superinfection exclusion B family protein [Hungatella sp.]
MKDFIDFLKLPPNILGALSIASGALLLLPDKLAEKLYMTEFRDKYGFTIGIIFVISTAILIVLLGSKVYHYFHDKSSSKKLVEAQIKYLKQMNPEQVAVIREFIQEPTHTLPLPCNNGLVIELQHFQIVTPAGQTHLVNMLDPQINYFLQPWVIQRISCDDELRQKFY